MSCVYSLLQELEKKYKSNSSALYECLSFLVNVGAVGLIDIFDICNIYVLEDYRSLWKNDLLVNLQKYLEIPMQNRRSYGNPLNHSNQVSFSNVVSTNDLRSLLSLFHYNASIQQIMQTPFFSSFNDIIDIHRLVVFCCTHKILRRVYVVPMIQDNAQKVYTMFENPVMSRQKRSIKTTEEFVGMPMDPIGSEEVQTISHSNLSQEHYLKAFQCYHYSLYHFEMQPNSDFTKESMIVELSKHVSCLLFLSHPEKRVQCTCNPDTKKILEMVKSHRCLEYIALHSNCCIPAVMNCLEKVENIIFLKVSHV